MSDWCPWQTENCNAGLTFFPVFRHLLYTTYAFSLSYWKCNTTASRAHTCCVYRFLLSADWTCRIYRRYPLSIPSSIDVKDVFFSTFSSMDVHLLCRVSPYPQPAVKTFKVYPFSPLAVWKCRVYCIPFYMLLPASLFLHASLLFVASILCWLSCCCIHSCCCLCSCCCERSLYCIADILNVNCCWRYCCCLCHCCCLHPESGRHSCCCGFL